MIRLTTAGLVVIKNRKLLLAFSKNKQAYYLPGGKTDPGETTVSALIREVKEELNIQLNEKELAFYMHVTAPAFGEANGIIMEQDCFLHDLQQTPHPNAEIGSVRFFDIAGYRLEPAQVPGVIMVMEQLKKDKLID